MNFIINALGKYGQVNSKGKGTIFFSKVQYVFVNYLSNPQSACGIASSWSLR